MDRENEFEKIERLYLKEQTGRDDDEKNTHKIDGVPLFDVEGKYSLRAIYYAVFSRQITITQISKVLDKEHIKGCGSDYAMFMIMGDQKKGFQIQHVHTTDDAVRRMETDHLNFLHWQANRTMHRLAKMTNDYGMPLVSPQIIEFSEDEVRSEKVERFVHALKDIG
ncbi:hypothetical protein LCGC14_2196470, partial [marine sediment metagenome]